MWKKIKPKVTRVVMWSIKNHWLWLVLVIGAQYLTGKVMVDPNSKISFSHDTLFKIHSFFGNLILVVAIGLALEKLYLWLIKKGKL